MPTAGFAATVAEPPLPKTLARVEPWQLNAEGRALADGALDKKPAMHQFYQLARQRQPDADPFNRFRTILQTAEGFKDHGMLLRRNSRAVICNGELNSVCSRSKFDGNMPFTGGVLDGVGQKVQDDLP